VLDAEGEFVSAKLDYAAAHERYLRAKYFGSLDGLRCLSIIMVIGFHCQLISTNFFRTGQHGVSLFFVISGFLITTLLLREQMNSGTISLPNFYIRRTLRIFPLYYAAVLLYTVLVFVMEHGPERGAYFHNLPSFLTYTNNWFVNKDASERVIFAFAWSLATEEQFYLFWPSVVRFASKVKWWMPLTIILGLAGIDMLMEIAAGLGSINYPWSTTSRFVSSVASSICLGCGLAYLFHRPGGFKFAWKLLGSTLAAPIALLLLLGTYLLYQHGVGLGEANLAAQHRAILFFEPPLILAMVLVVGACCIRNDNGLSLILGNAFVRYIGTISYGLYLLHMLAMNATKRIRSQHDWLFFAIALAISIAMATVSYWMYEQPFLKLKNRFRRPESPKADDHAEPATTVGSPESVILSEAKNLAGARV
jgi:peptidoglycan/LPS O-acetylase OafA/YrhL